MSEVTQILFTTEQLLPLVYQEMRRLTDAKMALETPNQMLQTAALAHEAADVGQRGTTNP